MNILANKSEKSLRELAATLVADFVTKNTLPIPEIDKYPEVVTQLLIMLNSSGMLVKEGDLPKLFELEDLDNGEKNPGCIAQAFLKKPYARSAGTIGWHLISQDDFRPYSLNTDIDTFIKFRQNSRQRVVVQLLSFMQDSPNKRFQDDYKALVFSRKDDATLKGMTDVLSKTAAHICFTGMDKGKALIFIESQKLMNGTLELGKGDDTEKGRAEDFKVIKALLNEPISLNKRYRNVVPMELY